MLLPTLLIPLFWLKHYLSANHRNSKLISYPLLPLILSLPALIWVGPFCALSLVLCSALAFIYAFIQKPQGYEPAMFLFWIALCVSDNVTVSICYGAGTLFVTATAAVVAGAGESLYWTIKTAWTACGGSIIRFGLKLNELSRGTKTDYSKSAAMTHAVLGTLYLLIPLILPLSTY